MRMLGVNIGGPGSRAAWSTPKPGSWIGERTPRRHTRQKLGSLGRRGTAPLKALVERFQRKGPVGREFPATIHNGVAKSASNIDKSWIGTDAAHLFVPM